MRESFAQPLAITKFVLLFPIFLDQRPSQRPHKQPGDASLSKTALERFVPRGHGSSSMPRAHPFVPPVAFAPRHVPAAEQDGGACRSFPFISCSPSGIPVPPAHPRCTSVLGTRTRGTTFLIYGERPAVTAAEPMAAADPHQPITETEYEPITQAIFAFIERSIMVDWLVKSKAAFALH
ncbi:hypothetical protein CTI12_AA155510 [Artemisia annua]|uniref:Uncharacterized protein n=1 Tax=Artemisia annua TaxID=35608 RepID=A0A2U1PGE7_ARTAN|nr:hypothetical protein CTI12_AA155510 [Artemisia annua]